MLQQLNPLELMDRSTSIEGLVRPRVDVMQHGEVVRWIVTAPSRVCVTIDGVWIGDSIC
jgi:hypothetical protein